MAEFHVAAATQLAKAGLLRLYRMRILDSVVAALYGVADGKCAYVYLNGLILCLKS